MEKGLGELGFWLAAGIVVAAMIVSGAIKERDRERERQATARADLEGRQATRQALVDKAGANMPEVLAYLRWAAAAACAGVFVTAGLARPVLGALMSGAPEVMGAPLPAVAGAVVAGLALMVRRRVVLAGAGGGWTEPME